MDVSVCARATRVLSPSRLVSVFLCVCRSSIFIGIGDKKNQQFKAIECVSHRSLLLVVFWGGFFCVSIADRRQPIAVVDSHVCACACACACVCAYVPMCLRACAYLCSRYSQPEVNIYNSRNFPTYENHDLFESLVFVDKHTQPSHDPCLNSLMHLYYGKLTPEVMMSNVTALFETGDMHIAVYSFQDNLMYVSNASPMIGNDTSSVIPAYNRPFIRLNMTTLFAHE